MTIDRNTPCVRSADRMLTVAEAERALEQAAAFIMRAQVAYPYALGQAAGAWLSSYGLSGKETTG